MNMPRRMQVIGDLERPDHRYLTGEHKCLYWGEYTPLKHTEGKLFDYSTTNRLIGNLKKTLDRRHKPDWQYKGQAIKQIGREYAKLWNWTDPALRMAALVPMPPSKSRDNPLYDDRILQVLTHLQTAVGGKLNIQDILSNDGRLSASHGNEDRADPDSLIQHITVHNDFQDQPPPERIIIFDDVLTTGAHFTAATSVLSQIYPKAKYFGCFVARTVYPEIDF